MTKIGRPATGRTSRTVTVRIPDLTYQQLQAQAQRAGKGASAYAKQLVLWGIAREPKNSRLQGDHATE